MFRFRVVVSPALGWGFLPFVCVPMYDVTMRMEGSFGTRTG